MNTKPMTGFTLIEVALAMAITALVGLSVAGATMVLSTTYQQGENYQDYVQSARSSSLRLQTLLRRAKLITSCTTTSIVFWAGDANSDSQINVSELVRVSYNTATKELHESQLDLSGLPPATAAVIDSVLPLSTAMDEGAVCTLLGVTYKNYCDDRLLANNVRSVEFRADYAPPSTHRVSLRLDVGDGEQNLVVQPAVTLRSPCTDRVGIANNQYVLVQGAL